MKGEIGQSMAKKSEPAVSTKTTYWGVISLCLVFIYLSLGFVSSWVGDYNEAISISGLSAQERIELEEYEASQLRYAENQRVADEQVAEEQRAVQAEENAIMAQATCQTVIKWCQTVIKFGGYWGFLFMMFVIFSGRIRGT